MTADSAARLQDALESSGTLFHRLGGTFYIFPDSSGSAWNPGDVVHRRLLHRRASLEDLFLKLTGKELTS